MEYCQIISVCSHEMEWNVKALEADYILVLDLYAVLAKHLCHVHGINTSHWNDFKIREDLEGSFENVSYVAIEEI